MKKKIIALLIVATMVLAGTSTIFAETTDANYLTFTALQANSTITINYESGELWFNDGINWKECTSGTTITIGEAGAKVSFKGNGVETNATDHFSMTGKIAASGDVTSLTNGTGGDATLTEGCYYSMFQGCASLTTAPELPSTTLSECCYSYMFSGCTGLTTVPELPATTLTKFCYDYMFCGCTGLETAPELPAINLTDYCYCGMFAGCTGLKTAPELPATTLTEFCYSYMFYGCTALEVCQGDETVNIIIKNCPSTDAYECVEDMFAETGGTCTTDPEKGKTYYYISYCTVSYDGNGEDSGTVPEGPKDYATGETATVLGNTGSLAKTGYVFDGWNTKADGTGTDYAEGDKFKPVEDTTLYAKWTEGPTQPESTTQPGKPTIVVEGNGTWVRSSSGTLSFTANYDYEKFSYVTVDGTVIDPENYDVKEGSTIVTLKKAYLDGLENGMHTLGIVWEDASANAQFTICDTQAEYPVTFDSMGGTAVNGQHHAKGEKLTVPANPTKDGYTFAGWYMDKNYTQAWNFNLYTVSGPTTLYAKWTAAGAGTGGSGTTPNTGDSNTAWPYAVLGILAAAAIAGICFKKRKTD